MNRPSLSYRLLLGLFMSLFMSMCMSFVMTWVNTGMDSGFLHRWPRAWIVGFCAAYPTALIFGPAAQRLTESILNRKKAANG